MIEYSYKNDDLGDPLVAKEHILEFKWASEAELNFIKDNSDVHVETVMIEDYLGGYETYEQLISDHRPVLMSIPFDKIKIDFKLNELMYNELTGKMQVSILYNQMNVLFLYQYSIYLLHLQLKTFPKFHIHHQYG